MALTKDHIGRDAWLIPGAPTAPGAAYQQPKVTILAVTAVDVAIQLPDGSNITTAHHNIRLTPPTEPKARNAKPDRYVIDPRHGVELQLF